MSANNLVTVDVEKYGARTFSSAEMSFACLGLLHPIMMQCASDKPIVADLNGAFDDIPNLNEFVQSIRSSISEQTSLLRAVARDRSLDEEILHGPGSSEERKLEGITARSHSRQRKANIEVQFPNLPSEQRLEKLRQKCGGLVNLESVVVMVGFGEVGPFGNSRTRWEMEAFGEFSLEGCIELAWMMGLIKYSRDPRKGSGWVDAQSGEPVSDTEVKRKYEQVILKHTGIRLVEPELFDEYDPHRKLFLQAVALQEDMPAMECSHDQALNIKLQHGDAVHIYQQGSDGVWFARMKKGAQIYVPKALQFDRFVAGQVPSTWNPSVLGIPDDIIQQVDRVTLFTLVSITEALISAGVTDPYEFYQYVHVRDVGNTIGGGFGGMQSIRDTHRNRFLERDVQGDALQEQFINTCAAWVNMLLLSSSGAILTPVGACATAVESVDAGVMAIRSGKARIVVVGGYDDFGEEGSYEFAQMKATVDSKEDIEAGREPAEMSRPATSTRAGFVEAQGAGVEILMSADLAIKMGVPIYGIISLVSTATDKQGRSVPAPGKGILTTAAEKHLPSTHKSSTSSSEEKKDNQSSSSNDQSQQQSLQGGSVSERNQTLSSPPILNVEYRRKRLNAELEFLESQFQMELDELRNNSDITSDHQALKQSVELLNLEFDRRKKAARNYWGTDFYLHHPNISPLRGALAVYGLGIDDIGVASFHGTSTKGNDLNESQVLQAQLEHLGRKKGNVILSIFQKYLTGHPKGAAAAWMLNGLAQSLMTGIVPGNRNADNIDHHLRENDHLVFLNKSCHTYGFESGLLKSFGFGQVGGEILMIHPDYLLAQLSDSELETYSKLRATRLEKAYRYTQDSMTSRHPYVQVKNAPPYPPELEQEVYLDPTARAQYVDGSWKFLSPQQQSRRDSSRMRTASLNLIHQSMRSGSSLEGPRGDLGRVVEHSDSGLHMDSPGAKQRSRKSTLTRRMSGNSLAQLEVTLKEMGEGMRSAADKGIGVDAQLIPEIELAISHSSEFLGRNFTPNETAYCRSCPNPGSSFAGRWAAKEAVIKAISSADVDLNLPNLWRGPGAGLKDIEIIPSEGGAPQVILHGQAKEVANLLGISSIRVTISHSGEYAISHAVAR